MSEPGRYDISDSGARETLDEVSSQAEAFAGHQTTLGESIAAAGEAANSGYVSEALSEFGQAKASDIQSISDLINSAHGGASTALDAYAQGDQQMAENAQTPTAESGPPGGQGGNPGSGGDGPTDLPNLNPDPANTVTIHNVDQYLGQAAQRIDSGENPEEAVRDVFSRVDQKTWSTGTIQPVEEHIQDVIDKYKDGTYYPSSGAQRAAIAALEFLRIIVKSGG